MVYVIRVPQGESCARLDAAAAVPKDVLNFLSRYKPIDCDCCNTTVGFVDRQTGRIRCNPHPASHTSGTGTTDAGNSGMLAIEGSPFASNEQQVNKSVDVVDGCMAAVAVAKPTPLMQVEVSRPIETPSPKKTVGTAAGSPAVAKQAAVAAAAGNPEVVKKAPLVAPAAEVAPPKVSAPATPSVDLQKKVINNVAPVEVPKKSPMVESSMPPPTPVRKAAAPVSSFENKNEAEKKEKDNPFFKAPPLVPTGFASAKPTAASNNNATTTAPTPVKPTVANAKPVASPTTRSPANDNNRAGTQAAKNLGQPLGVNPFRSSRPKNSWLRMKFSPNLQSGSAVKATFTYALNRYQVQAVADEDAVYAVQEKIVNYIAANPAKTYAKLNKKPVIDEVVLGLYNQEEYYRARIMNVREKECTMMFIDFGDTGKNTYEELYEINDELMQIPVYSLTLGLLGIPREVPAEIQLSNELNDRLAEKVTLELSGLMTATEALQADGVLRDPTTGRTINECIIELLGQDE